MRMAAPFAPVRGAKSAAPWALLQNAGFLLNYKFPEGSEHKYSVPPSSDGE